MHRTYGVQSISSFFSKNYILVRLPASKAGLNIDDSEINLRGGGAVYDLVHEKRHHQPDRKVSQRIQDLQITDAADKEENRR